MIENKIIYFDLNLDVVENDGKGYWGQAKITAVNIDPTKAQEDPDNYEFHMTGFGRQIIDG